MSKDLVLRFATIEDAQLLLDWRNDPIARENSFSSEIVKYEEHIKWYNAVLNDPNIYIYILEYDGKPIGQTRFSIENNTADISYYIATEYRGHGYATKMMSLAEKKMFDLNSNIIFEAEVKLGNIASQKVFKKLKYELIKAGDILVFQKSLRRNGHI